MKRTTVVHLPDGGVERRNSETRRYEWAVVVATDNRARADRLRREAAGLDEVFCKASEIIQSGDLSELEREHTSSNGRGERFYSSRVPGATVSHWLPDWQRPASWTEYIDNALRRIQHDAAKRRAEATELDAGPGVGYYVYRWSERRDSADKAASGFRGNPEDKTSVVPCQES